MRNITGGIRKPKKRRTVCLSVLFFCHPFSFLLFDLFFIPLLELSFLISSRTRILSSLFVNFSTVLETFQLSFSLGFSVLRLDFVVYNSCSAVPQLCIPTFCRSLLARLTCRDRPISTIDIAASTASTSGTTKPKRNLLFLFTSNYYTLIYTFCDNRLGVPRQHRQSFLPRHNNFTAFARAHCLPPNNNSNLDPRSLLPF